MLKTIRCIACRLGADAMALLHGGRVSRFPANRAGSAAVEFALVAAPLLLFILAIFQVALFHFTLQSLDDATRVAARRIMIGDVQLKGLTAKKFKTEVLCPALTFALTCSRITVNISPVAKSSSAKLKTGIYAFIRPEIPDLVPANLKSDGGDFCSSGPSSYVFVDVAYDFLALSALTGGFLPGGTAANPLVLRSTNFLYTEPYSAGAAHAGEC